MSKSIDIVSVFQDGFKLYSKNIVIALILGLISAIVSFLFANWQSGVRTNAFNLLNILHAVFTVSVSAILILYLHSLENNKDARIGNSVNNFLSNFFLVTMITIIALAAIIIGGFIFFIIPGILFFIWFSQTIYFLLLERKSPSEAMRASKKLTEGRRIAILVVFLVQGMISILISAVVTKLFPPTAALSISAIFPGTYFWFVGYVLYKKLKQ